MAIDPGPSRWQFPPTDIADAHGLMGVGADLEPATLLAAYRHGIFPMPLSRRGRIGWWSPNPRGILPLDGVHESRSLARTRRRFEIRVDTAFDEVVAACGDPSRPHGWINAAMTAAYHRLHRLGWAHSVETWADGELAGGLFGISIGGLFAGESMFHRRTDASKAAVLATCDLLRAAGSPAQRLFDVQWTTEHLCTLGAIDVDRADYERRLAAALTLPSPFPG
ncbi:MAG: leucyl/phenylalanyl-tRNA--protein transferase [Sporichthyaceae bacterium]